MLEQYVEDDYCARFDTHSYHSFTETHFNARLDIKYDKVTRVKSRPKALGHSVCLKSISRKVTIQGLIHGSYHCFTETLTC